jgi:hypothetical protein
MGLDVYDFPIRTQGIHASTSGSDADEVERTDRHISSVRSLHVWSKVVFISLILTGVAHAQMESPPLSPTSKATRIDRLEDMLKSVAKENRRLAAEVRELKEQSKQPKQDLPTPDMPTPDELASTISVESRDAAQHGPDGASNPLFPPELEAWSSPSVSQQSNFESRSDNFRVNYDNGFVIVPENLDQTPFSLKVNSQDVIRYNGFARGSQFFIDSAGNVNPITNSNYFGIPRGRLIFSGKALLPKLSYLLNIDYNSVTGNPIGFRAYELTYRINRAIELHAGQSKVPGSREWLESAFAALEGPDRSMATTFFRPSLSQGIWITGEPLDQVYYNAMLSNGFNTLNLTPTQLPHQYCLSGSAWWEPWGDFGRGYGDFEAHENPVTRIGACYTFALGQGSQSASDAVENSAIRLSDGTLITQTGAFAPGVTLQSYDISLAAIDFGFKYRGLSLSTEWYAQNLFSLVGDGPLPLRSTQAYGGYLQGGYFVVPRKVELYSRASFVTGHYGSGSETAGGLNWFIIPGKSNLRFTFDSAWLNSSPADQNRTGFVAGQTGLLIRTQFTVVY